MADDLRERLETLRRKIFDNKDMHPEGPLSEERLQAFERENGVSLPADYRLFLQTVGDGILGSNIYGIFPLGELPGADWSRGDLSKPFPMTRKLDYLEGDAEEDDAEDSASDGRLYVCHIGCGAFWILIVTGPERGHMWLTDENGYFPSVPRIGFLDWLEQWVEHGWDDGLGELASDETEE